MSGHKAHQSCGGHSDKHCDILVAGLMLTTECLIAERPKEDTAGAAAAD